MLTIRINTSDMGEKEYIEVDKSITEHSSLIKNMMTDVTDSDEPVPLINVTSDIFGIVLEIITFYEGIKPEDTSEELSDPENIQIYEALETQFFNDMEQSTLFELILASNFLDIKFLIDGVCQKIANLIKGKEPEEIRRTFNIKNDFTPEEEEKIIRENEWIDER